MRVSVLGVLCLCATVQAQEFQMTSLDWPPYTGEQLSQQGVTTERVKALLAKAGHNLNVRFMPWQRAVDTARNDPAFVGYFPEYLDPASPCLFSDPIGNGPLGLAERKDKPLKWAVLDDLKPFRVGVVSGYVNTAEFDAQVAAGQLKVDPASSDEQNLLKLANGRVDAAVVDKNVLEYLLVNSPKLKEVAGQLQFNGQLLEDKTLHVCFTNSEAGKQARDIFNAALKSQ